MKRLEKTENTWPTDRLCSRYTKEEDELIISIIRNNHQNLTQAFRKAAEQLRRTEKSITMRWYMILSKKKNVALLTIGKKSYLRNRKSVRINKQGTESNFYRGHPAIWKKVLKIIFGVG